MPGSETNPPRAEPLLAARTEQVRRIECDLADTRDQLAQTRAELDAARETLRWSEAVSEQRRRLLAFEQQLRVRAERERDALAAARYELEQRLDRAVVDARLSMRLRRRLARVPLLRRAWRAVAGRG